jgi:ABC-type polysaccharide/polyol phosphate export permease
MFTPVKRPPMRTFLSQMELIYHIAVRSVRKTHGNALISLLLNMFQTAMMVLGFYFTYAVLGLTTQRVRGDFILYIMSGIFMYVTHIRAIAAVTGADGWTSPMMKHAPMNPIVSIAGAALGSLYIQVLSMVAVLAIYAMAFHPITIDRPVQAFGMLLVAWFAGVAIGMIFRAAKPWQPELVTILTSVFQRANMVASGKMFLANSLTPKMLAIFSWNPLFHTIDQARGFTFANYNPHFSSWSYPLLVSCVCLMIGLIGEFYTGQHVSLSWEAGR